MGNTDKQQDAGQLGSDRRYLVAVIGFTCLYAAVSYTHLTLPTNSRV